jgi:hypothetical protein
MFASGTGTPEQRAEAVRGKLRRLCGSDRPIDWKGLAIIDLVSLYRTGYGIFSLLLGSVNQ